MLHLFKLLCYVGTHAQSRRRRVIHIGVCSLKVLQLAHEHIKIDIAYDRRIQYIVIMVMFMQLLAQLKYTCFRIHRHCFSLCEDTKIERKNRSDFMKTAPVFINYSRVSEPCVCECHQTIIFFEDCCCLGAYVVCNTRSLVGLYITVGNI